MLAVLAIVKVKPQHRDRFLKYLVDDAQGSLHNEPGCVRFDILRDEKDADCFYIYEVYRDAEAYALHQDAPHFKRFFAEAGDTLDGAPDIRMTTTVYPDAPGAWVKPA